MDDHGLLARSVLLPFRPDLWSRASRGRLRDVVLPLLLLAVFAHGALSALRAWQMHREVGEWIGRYDNAHPAITIADGRVSVDGDAVIRFEEGGKTFLVDPRETVKLDEITSSEYIVVRERQIIQKRPLRNQVIEVRELQALLPDPLRIDGTSLRAFHSRWGVVLLFGALVLMLFFLLLRDAIAALVFCPLAALVASKTAARDGRTLGFGPCLNVAVGAYAPLLLVHLLLNLLGTGPGACVGLWLWPALLTGLVWWRVRAAVAGVESPRPPTLARGSATAPPRPPGPRPLRARRDL